MESIINKERLWQWRTHTVMRLQKRTDPFPYCSSIGLDFNVGSKKKKIDLHSMTNGAAVEICQFAKAINGADKHFVYEILEFNFDLGVESEEQMYAFVSRTHTRLQALRKEWYGKQRLLYDPFLLPDVNSITSCCKHQSMFQKCLGASDAYENDLNLIDTTLHSVQSSGGCGVQEEHTSLIPKEESMRDLFPFCEEIGLVLDVISNPKLEKKLDINLLTNGVVIEVANFVKSLCGFYYPIISDVLKHNFDIDLESEEGKKRCPIYRMNSVWKEKVKTKAFREEALEWRKRPREPIDKGKTCTLTKHEGVKKNRDALNLRSNGFMCPVEEKDLETQTCSESDCNASIKNCSLSLNKGTPLSENTCESQTRDLLNTTMQRQEVDQSSEEMDVYVAVESSVKSVESGQARAIFSRLEESSQATTSNSTLVQTPPGVNKELKIKSNRWMEIKEKCVRMKRARDGVSVTSETFEGKKYSSCKEIGLDFSMKSPIDAKLHLRLLTRGVIFEIHKYAMEKSWEDYVFNLYDILEHNFDLESQKHRSWELSLFIASQVKQMVKRNLLDLEKRTAYGKEIFELPLDYPSSSKKPRN